MALAAVNGDRALAEQLLEQLADRVSAPELLRVRGIVAAAWPPVFPDGSPER